MELLRQMFELYGFDIMRRAMTTGQAGTVEAPGIVAIDEVDAHLHPTWQRDIGKWLTKHFPKILFIVTTHSPIVCRSVVGENNEIKGSVWRLPVPGSHTRFQKVEDVDLQALAYGDVLDAYGTQLFGRDVIRSEAGRNKVSRLAELNNLALDRNLNDAEKLERSALRTALPQDAGRLSS